MIPYDLLPDETRVWIYQASRALNDDELQELRTALVRFVADWTSHNHKLNAFGEIFHKRFIVLMVDESQAGASGCSIDKSVYFIKEVEKAFEINLFDRMTFTYREGNEIKAATPR
jgi:hypothetical protein